jgi:hypothetical protein
MSFISSRGISFFGVSWLLGASRLAAALVGCVAVVGCNISMGTGGPPYLVAGRALSHEAIVSATPTTAAEATRCNVFEGAASAEAPQNGQVFS